MHPNTGERTVKNHLWVYTYTYSAITVNSSTLHEGNFTILCM